MSEYNAADTKAIRKAKQAARVAESERQGVILNLMSSPAGRSYVLDNLTRCHVFASSFSVSPFAVAFAEGERNIGLQLLNDVMAFAPDQYVQMMREANDRRISNDRESRRSGENTGGGDSGRVADDDSPGSGAVSEYDPALNGIE